MANFGIEDLEYGDYEEDEDSSICLPHLSLKTRSEDLDELQTPWKKPTMVDVLDPPAAPKKIPVDRPRLPTETRDDVLEETSNSDDTTDIPCGWLDWVRSDQEERVGADLPCEPLVCSECCQEVWLSVSEGEHFIGNVKAMAELPSGEPSSIDTGQYRILATSVTSKSPHEAVCPSSERSSCG